MPHEDEVVLGGQTFPVRESVVVKPASEFTTGLKVGRATYDERLHAFWLVLDDFSGGINHRRLDIREALGTAWDNPDGVDIRRPGHVTLPPLQASATFTAPAAYDYTARQPSIPIVGSDVGGTLLNIAGFGGALYWSAGAGASWTKIKDIGNNAYMVARILEFAADGTTRLYAFPEGTAGAAQYERCSGDPKTSGNWAAGGAGATKVWEDAIIIPRFGQDVILATTPIAKIGYSEDGANWNVDDPDPDVAEPIWQANYGRIQFVGKFMGPWGGSAVYMLARSDAGLNCLFALDFDTRQAVLIDIGNKMHLHDALIWNGSVIVTDGWSVKQYNPGATEVVRDISFPRKSGLCPTLAGGVIVKLIGGTDYLYAILFRGDGSSQILAYNGAGWTTLGPAVANLGSVVGSILSDWQPATVATTRRVCMMGGVDASAPFSTVGTPKTVTLTLPNAGEVPTVGTDSFTDGPLQYTTGWIDGGFHEVDGTLFWMKIDAFSLSGDETVKVEYALDNVESWTQMRDSSNVAAVFTSLTTTLYFSAAMPKKGIQFRTVMFRVTLDRGGTATNSPELIALILLYNKKPELREAWSFRIDVNRMLEMKTTYQVDGADATVARIWAKLRTLWDTKPLIVLDVPNIRTGILVQLTDMPGTFDDFRNAVDGKGYIDVQVLEPVNA